MMGKSVVFFMLGRRRAGRSASVLGSGLRCVERRRRRSVLEMLGFFSFELDAEGLDEMELWRVRTVWRGVERSAR